MTTTDYLITAVLALMVVPQIRGMKINLTNAVRSIVLVGAAAAYYLKAVPTGGHDVPLYLLGALVGGLLGLGCALTTRISRNAEGVAIAKAGVVAAVLWVVGMVARSGFVYAATHSGAQAITDFSIRNQITGRDAWTTALLLTALAQVLIRLVVLRVRVRLGADRGPALAQA